MFLEGEVGSLSRLQGVRSLPRLHGHLEPHCPAPPRLGSSPPEPLPAALRRARCDSLPVLLGTPRGLLTVACPSPQVTWLQPVTLGIPIYTLATRNSSEGLFLASVLILSLLPGMPFSAVCLATSCSCWKAQLLPEALSDPYRSLLRAPKHGHLHALTQG